ncbi:6-phosphogluconolactonase, partial [Amycolatopsis sp. NPDC000673]
TAKADAVAQALAGAPETQIPVSGARGYRRTLWLLDREAAGKLTKVYEPPAE